MRSPRTATKSCPHSPQLEKARAQQRRPNAAKNKQTNKCPAFCIFLECCQLLSKHQPGWQCPLFPWVYHLLPSERVLFQDCPQPLTQEGQGLRTLLGQLFRIQGRQLCQSQTKTHFQQEKKNKLHAINLWNE